MKLNRALVSIVALLTAGLSLSGCLGSENPATPTPVPGVPTQAPTLTPVESGLIVFAAASLRDAFTTLGDGFPSTGFEKLTYNFAGSQVLATQLSQGAPADVFVSADSRSMNDAASSGAIVTGTQKLLATNKLVVVVPQGGTTKVATLKDLANPGLKVVLADPSVPAGSYALQALDKLAVDPAYGPSFKAGVLANVVSRENNVRQVLTKVQLGEADAGIVYSTDTMAASKPLPGGGRRPTRLSVGTIEIPPQYNVVAQYYIAPVKNARHADTASRFIDYVLSEQGQKVLQSYGFGPANGGK